MNGTEIKDYFSLTFKIAEELYKNGKTIESLMCFVQVVPLIRNLLKDESDMIIHEFSERIDLLGSIAIDLEDAGNIEMSEVARKTHLIYNPSYIWYGSLGNFYLGQKDFALAKSNLEKALELLEEEHKSELPDANEDEMDIRQTLGQAYLELGEFENAVTNLSRAREIAFKSGDDKWNLWHYGGKELLQNIYLSLYDDYFPKHYTDFCLLLLHKTIFEDGEYSDDFLSKVYRRQGECYINKANLQEAVFRFKKVLEIDPNDTYIKNMLSTIEKIQLEKEERGGIDDSSRKE